MSSVSQVQDGFDASASSVRQTPPPETDATVAAIARPAPPRTSVNRLRFILSPLDSTPCAQAPPDGLTALPRPHSTLSRNAYRRVKARSHRGAGSAARGHT